MEVVDERQIGSAVPDRTQRLSWLGLDHGDLDGAVGGGRHGGQGGREQRLPGAGKRHHGQGLRPVRVQGAQPPRGGLQLGVDRVGRGEQDPAGAGLACGSVLLVGGSVAASSLLDGYPVLGGQAVRYLAAGLVLAAWARLRRTPLPRPAGREWAWLAGLAVIGLAGCSVLLIEATRVADPASVGVIIGAAPLVIIIIIAAAIGAGNRPHHRLLLAAAVVTAGSATAQLGGATGPTWSATGLLWSAGALGGVVGSSVLAAPILPRLGALAVTVYAWGWRCCCWPPRPW